MRYCQKSAVLRLIGVAPKDIFFKESRVFFDEIEIEEFCIDISDAEKLDSVLNNILPDVIIHLGAQSLVNNAISNPLKTFSTNILGTANLLTSVGSIDKKIVILNITSDKVYKNIESLEPFTENSELGGLDPYSCSKSCAELVSNSFFETYVKNYS